MRRKKEQGFGFVGIIILILLLLLIGFIIWYVFWGSKSGQEQSQPAAQNGGGQSQQTPVATDPYQGWKEYCSPKEKSCFKYPADWTLQKDPNAYQNEEFMQIVSPGGTTVNWAAEVTGVGGACEPEPANIVYIKTVKPVPGVADLYVAGTGAGAASGVERMGLINGAAGKAPQVGSTGDCLYVHMFKSKDGARQMWLYAGSIKQGDAANVELVLSSFYY